MFAERAAFDLRKNRITLRLEERLLANNDIIDLTESNPTAVGFHYPEEAILNALSLPDSLRYEPSAKGLEKARISVSRYYHQHGRVVSADDTVLTSSTSEAYSLVFKLLADPGDQILIPSPSYPLFDFLARLECAQTVSYPLYYEGGWRIDLDQLESSLSPRTKAVVLVNPNNPTGSYVRRGEWNRLKEVCIAQGIAVICDEVFMDYRIDDKTQSFDPWSEIDLLTFLLNGLSKASGLPQVKLGWITVCGPDPEKRQSLERLEVIADTFLSVGTPIQHATPVLLKVSKQVRSQIQGRIRSNYDFLQKACLGTCVQCLATEGGWSAVLRLPRVKSEEEWVIHYLETSNVLVHPGYFFDFTEEAFLVLSLLPNQLEFEEGVSRLLSAT